MVPKGFIRGIRHGIYFGASIVDIVPKGIELSNSLFNSFDTRPIYTVSEGMIAVITASFYFDTNLINMISKASIN